MSFKALNAHSSWSFLLGWLREQDCAELNGFKFTVTGDYCEVRTASRTMMGGVIRNYPESIPLTRAADMLVDSLRSIHGWRNIPIGVASNQISDVKTAFQEAWERKYNTKAPIRMLDGTNIAQSSEEEFLSSKYVDKGMMTGYVNLDERGIRAVSGVRRLMLSKGEDGVLSVKNPANQSVISKIGRFSGVLKGQHTLDIMGFSDTRDSSGNIFRVLVVEGQAEAVMAINNSKMMEQKT